MKIKIAENDTEILSCFNVIKELRTGLKDENDLLQRYKRQSAEYGYKLVLLYDDGVKSAAGIRISEFLAWGRILYIDDLVTLSSQRSKGYGEELFKWLIQYANDNDCGELHLDSGVQRFDTHRFYLNHKMKITSHHFAMKLK